MQGILLFAHGARADAWATPFRAVRDRLRSALPDQSIELAFLEFMSPDFDRGVDLLCTQGVTRLLLPGYVDSEREKLVERIRSRVNHYAPLMGVHPGRITIRDQKSRWGSCSSAGTLSFNYRLMMAPPRVLDYVVVHELCHLTHMNHSKDFWNMVERILPDYKESKNWLKEHGKELTVLHYINKPPRT